MIRLLHIADLHLGWEPKYLPADKRKVRRGERDQLLQKAVEIVISPALKIDGMIIVGDLFENFNPEESLVRETLNRLRRITDQGKMLVTVPGNHDEITYRESVYRTRSGEWPGYLVTNPMPAHCFTHVIRDIPVHIYSLAFTGGLTKAADISTLPRLGEGGLHIGAFHASLDWDGLPDRSLPLSSAKLTAAGYHYTALGHYHQFSEKNTGSGKAVYPGAVEFKSFSDPGTGYFTVVQWDGTAVTLDKIPASVRPWQTITIDISMASSLQELKAQFLAHGTGDRTLQLSLVGTPRFHFKEEQLLNEIESSCFYVELNNSAQYFSDEFLDSIAKETTVRGLFVKRIQNKLKNTTDPHEQKVLEQALRKGLLAFERGDRR